MIEVEKKFQITNAQRDRLLEGAEFVYKKDIRDTYFDRGVELCTKDLWLRERDGRFELKYLTKGYGSRKPISIASTRRTRKLSVHSLTGEMLTRRDWRPSDFLRSSVTLRRAHRMRRKDSRSSLITWTLLHGVRD